MINSRSNIAIVPEQFSAHTEKIKVAQIIGNSKTGGVPSCVMNYYRNLDRSKIQFDFYTYGPAPVDDEIRALGGNVYYMPSLLLFPIAVPRLIILLRRRGYVAVHSHMTSLSVFPLFSAMVAGVPARICHAHSTTFKREKRGVVKNTLKMFSTTFATDLMGCSESSIEWLYRPKRKSKAYYLRNAINLDKFKDDLELRETEREALGYTDNYVIGHIGRFEYQKNHEFLVEVFNEVHKKLPEARLVLCGIGSLETAVVEQITALELNDVVTILPEVVDVERYFNAFDVFVLPSRYEGLPLVAVEAQAIGLTCLLSSEVTEETNITGTCQFLSLSRRKWIKAIIEAKDQPRHDSAHNRAMLAARGYDIKEAVYMLESYYEWCNHRNERKLKRRRKRIENK